MYFPLQHHHTTVLHSTNVYVYIYIYNSSAISSFPRFSTPETRACEHSRRGEKLGKMATVLCWRPISVGYYIYIYIVTRLAGMEMKSLWAIAYYFWFALLLCSLLMELERKEAGRGLGVRWQFDSLSAFLRLMLGQLSCLLWTTEYIYRACRLWLVIPFLFVLLLFADGRMENLANRRQMADQAAGTNGSAALASEDFGTSQIGIVDTPVHRPLCCMAKKGCARKNKKKKPNSNTESTVRYPFRHQTAELRESRVLKKKIILIWPLLL